MTTPWPPPTRHTNDANPAADLNSVVQHSITHDSLGAASAHPGGINTSDPRLSDARTPTAHALSHLYGHTDALPVDSDPNTPSFRRTDGSTAGSAAPYIHTHPAYSIIQDDTGTPVAQRDTVKFVGGRITDDGAHTVITIPTAQAYDLPVVLDRVALNTAGYADLIGTAFPVRAGEIWLVSGEFLYEATTSAGLRIALVIPVGSILGGSWRGFAPGATVDTGAHRTVGIRSSGTPALLGGLGIGTTAVASLNARFAVGSTSGEVVIQFAQNVAENSALTVRPGSFLSAVRIS